MKEVLKNKEAPADEVSPKKESGISRREFLIGGGVAALSVFFGKRVEAAAKLLEKKKPSKEAKSGSPKIRFEFFFTHHATAEDLKGFEEKFKEADIFIPETAGWTQEYRIMLDDVSAGRRTVEDVLRGSMEKIRQEAKDPNFSLPPTGDVLKIFLRIYKGRVLELLYNSKKPVFLLDLPQGHALNKYSDDTHEKVNEIEIDFNKPFEDILGGHKQDVKAFTDAQKAREAYFLSGLTELKEKLEKNPGRFAALKGKKEIRALIPFGAVHTRLYHHLKRSGEETARTFSGKELGTPYVLGTHTADIIRQSYFDKEVSDELAARSIFSYFIGALIYQNLSRPPADTRLTSLFVRSIVNKFSFEEIKMMFDAVRISVPNSEQALFMLIEQKFVEKGVKIPGSVEELESVIQTTKTK